MNLDNNWKKNIVLFLTSQNISLIGSALVQYAISWYIVLETQSGIMVSISIVCGFLPTFLISPFAGVWADRFNKKFTIITADSVIAISTLVLAILFLIGFNDIWLLFVVSIVRSLGSGIQTPTVNALIPSIVPSDKLMKTNGANSSLQSIVTLISPMLSGALLTVSSIEIIFFIDVITAALAISILFFFLHFEDDKNREKQKINYFNDLKEGIKYINKTKLVKVFFIFSAVFYVLSGPLMFLTPLQVTRTFGNEVWRLTAIEITFSAGMIVGGILMSVWGGFKRRVHTMIIANFFIAFSTLALGVVPIFWIYCAVMLLIGITIPAFNTPFMVLLQQNVEPSYLGRVFSVSSMLASLILPLSMLGYGPLADYVKIEWILIVTGILLIIFCFSMLFNKTIMTFEKNKEQQTERIEIEA